MQVYYAMQVGIPVRVCVCLQGPSDKPDAIIGPSLIYVEPYLVVFGGGDGRRPSNDLHTLDMHSMLWRKIQTEGAPPAPRVGHSATQLGQSMVIFGGPNPNPTPGPEPEPESYLQPEPGPSPSAEH